jgi:hypothetical protein
VWLLPRRLAAWFRRSRSLEADSTIASERLERAIEAYRARDWSVGEPLFRAVIGAPDTVLSDRQVARNILGAQYLRTGRASEAVELFEANVTERFSGNYPYERLASIYGREQRFADAARVLRRAIEVVAAQPDCSGDLATRLARLRAALAEVAAGQAAAGL